MTLEDLTDYLKKARFVDLTKKVTPGAATGPFETGSRQYEIEPFTFPPGELMHRIRMESHISTHVEAPSHYVTPRYGRPAKDVSELPPETFVGPAILIDCKDFPAGTPVGREILQRYTIRTDDIVLLGNSPHSGDDRCYLDRDGSAYLAERRVKLVGWDDTFFGENPLYRRKDFEKYYTHDNLLSNDIPMVEGLANLGSVQQERFFFLGLPAKMGGLESFPIRAVAIVADE